MELEISPEPDEDERQAIVAALTRPDSSGESPPLPEDSDDE